MTADIFGAPQSYWLDSTPRTDYPALDKDITADVVVVGGGLSGITSAYLLGQAGLKAVVVEADGICQGTTAYSTAKITSQHNLIYDQLMTQFGEERARQYAAANEQAISWMAATIKEQGIDCDFRWQPAYLYTQQDKYIKKIQKEAQAAANLGIKAEYLEQLDLPFPIKAAVRFDGQAQFHPRKYVLALAKMFVDKGGEIYEHSRAIALEEGNPHVVVTKTGKTVSAKWVVIASHFPFHDGLGLYFARMYPDRSYILGIKTNDKLSEGMYVTAESPGRSLRIQHNGDQTLLLVAGEHHKTAHGEDQGDHYLKLRDFAVSAFDVVDIPYRWSTQDYTTIDKVPYIGPARSGVSGILVATGFRKWGITNSTVSGLLFRDLVIKGKSPWQDVYNPQRHTSLRAVGQLTKQNIHVAQLLVSGKLQRPTPAEEIKKGEGRTVDIKGQRLGAYRDKSGKLHILDITCTHLGCEAKWNSAEETWDCPCHGSRFSSEGEIMEGPATNPLHHLPEGANDIDPDII